MNTVKRKVSVRPKKVDERCEKVSACVYGDTGLVPAIIQDYESGVVLSFVYMNEEAVNATFESGYVKRKRLRKRARVRATRKRLSAHFSIIRKPHC